MSGDTARSALTYIAAPTMGLPPGVDAAEFAVSGASEADARGALQNCILTARQALSELPPDDSTASTDQPSTPPERTPAEQALRRVRITCEMSLRQWGEGGPQIVTTDEILGAIDGRITARVAMTLALEDGHVGDRHAEIPDDVRTAAAQAGLTGALAEIEGLLFASVQSAFASASHDLVWAAMAKTRALLDMGDGSFHAGSEHEQFQVVGPWGVDGATSAADGWANKDDHDQHYPDRAHECTVQRRTALTFDDGSEYIGPWSVVPRPAPEGSNADAPAQADG